MSEPENETLDDEETPFVAPDGADEPNPDDEDNIEPEPEPEPAHEPEPEQGGMTEKEMEARQKRIDTARTTFFRKVGEIMEEAAADLVLCPACSHFVPGMVFPQEFSDEQKFALWPYMGLPNPDNRTEAPDRHRCETCAGWGQVKTGSLIPEYALGKCRDCSGTGYRDDALTAGGRGEAPNDGGTFDPSDAPPMPEDEAWIEAAKARGYTVIPPWQAPVSA